MKLIQKYFPGIDPVQQQQFEKLLQVVPELNDRVNVISRTDIEYLEERHVLHSLGIAKKFSFNRGTRVVDVGTGGGFPGIPLAILYPEAEFLLVDSIGKKVKLVGDLVSRLELSNVIPLWSRMEELNQKFDFVVSRAVTAFPKLHRWSWKLIRPGNPSGMPNGLISLKGGDLTEELHPFGNRIREIPLQDWFEEPFFSSKKIVYLKK